MDRLERAREAVAVVAAWQRWHWLRRRDIRSVGSVGLSVGKSALNANGQRAISVWVYVSMLTCCTLGCSMPCREF